MMNALLQQTLKTLFAYRVKSVLAIIAITWGVLSVLVLLAIGEGFYRHQSKAFSVMISDAQLVFPSTTSKTWQGLPEKRRINFSQQHLNQLEQSGLVQQVSAVYSQTDSQITNKKGLKFARRISGIDSNYFPLMQSQLKAGSRNISPTDILNRTRVAILGNQIAAMGQVEINDQIHINHVPFRVIGIISNKNTGYSFGASRAVFIPNTTYLSMWDNPPWMLLLVPYNHSNIPLFQKNIVQFLAKILHFDPSDREAIRQPDLAGSSAIFKSILRGIQLFLGVSGAMTLAVGALGVANIMFLSVTDRTREVGVRLAIGATPRLILAQFLLEGLILVAVGALTGLLLAYAAVLLLTQISLPEWSGTPVITFGAIAQSLILTSLLALLAAYFPARRASRLTPVIALGARG